MNRVKVLFVIIAVAAAGFFVGRGSLESPLPTLSDRPARAPVETYQTVAEPPAYSAAEANDLRSSNYLELNDIDGVLDLPSDFAQTEALYALAGRADRVEVERLIVQAINISNRYDRVAALGILFGRYTEIDPEAAVDHLVELRLDVDEQMFRSIFDAWTKTDVNAAVAKANGLTNARQRRQASYTILRTTVRFNEPLLEQVAADLTGNFDLDGYRSEAVGVRANSNPQLALQEALAMTDRSSRWGAISNVATVWARNDPEQAMNALEQIGDQQSGPLYARMVMARWIADDPDQAMQYLLAYPEGRMRQQLMQEGLTRLAQDRPQEALTYVAQLNGQGQEVAMMQIFNQWAFDDTDGAVIGIMALDDASQRDRLIASIGQKLAMRSPEKALRFVQQFGADPTSNQVVEVLTTMAHSDPRYALEHVMTHFSGSARTSTLLKVLQQASYSDPSLLLDYVSQLPDSAQANQLYRSMASSLAMRDPDAAIQLIDTLTGAAKLNAIEGTALSLSTSNPAMASELIAQMPPDRKSQMIQNVSQSMAHRDPENALAWLEQYRGQSSYDNALTQIVQTVARKDPLRALDLSATLGGSQRVQATSAALSRWARTSPADAARWASTADASVQLSALSSVAEVWARTDPANATRWAMSLPSGAGRDRALVTLTYQAATTVNGAVDVVTRISSESQRNEAIRLAYNRLLDSGGLSSADELLDEVGASDELRQQLQRSVGR